MRRQTSVRQGNLWLAETLWKLGAIQFGSFTLGRTTIDSPVYINLRLLVSHPASLARAANVIQDELKARLAMRHPQVAPFTLVAGVPFGGLHLATAFSLAARTPMIYLHPRKDTMGNDIEGHYRPGETVLILDDLMTGGGSLLETAIQLEEAGLRVHDAVVLVDRQQGARQRLRQQGIRVISILTLEVILNYLMSSGRITEDWYRRSMEFLDSHRDLECGPVT